MQNAGNRRQERALALACLLQAKGIGFLVACLEHHQSASAPFATQAILKARVSAGTHPASSDSSG